jgi:perosamine synthetase
MSADREGELPVPHSRPQLGHRERLAVLAALDRSWVGAGGPAGSDLEDALAASFGRPAAVAVSSGSAALEAALRVADVAGEQVAIPAFACGSIERAVVRAGGRPHLVDSHPDDLSFPPGTLRSLAGRCKAAIVVHQFGLPAASAVEAAQAAQAAGMAVIEDVTTCAGGRVMGRSVGTFGRLVVMSFSATKMLCGAEGGAVAGSVKDVEAARRWIDPESDLPPDAPVPHAKMADLAAALARVQLERLPEFLARRAEIARLYDDALGEDSNRVLRPPHEAPNTTSGTWWRYLIAVQADATDAVKHGRAEGVGFARPVPRRLWHGRGDFPVSERLYQTLVSVPIFPALTDREIDRVRRVLPRVVRIG